jgi:hypothetical protein
MNNLRSTVRNLYSIELHIEELVLQGFAPGDRYCIANAVERELLRLFAEQRVPPFTYDIEGAHIDAGAFNVAPDSKQKQPASR